MKKSAVSKLLLFVPVFALLVPDAALAGGEEEFELGRKAFYAKDYDAAEGHFSNSVGQGNRTPRVWLFVGHTFLAKAQYERAVRTYELLLRNFKDSEEAKVAQESLNVAKQKMTAVPSIPPVAPVKPAELPKATGAVAIASAAPASTGLKERIYVEPPKFSHPAVGANSVKAIREAVASLPPHLRKALDESNATIHIAPNLIDKWPESLADLEKEEQEEAPTLAEVPGRIYGNDMWMYERPKVRHSTHLGNARPAWDLKHTVYNMCFQVLDGMWKMTSDAKIIAQYEAEKAQVGDSYRDRLATYLKEDEWGRKETCNDLAALLLGQGDEKAADLARCFPKTKNLIKAKLNI